ncbi:helix-turn-helix domain-containing protein [Cetobacterium sp. 2A]|uniref:helix-turn-helix domain-containing protein n=1 Tax=Cetobacterium sp. 2A TaxID=2754723 RepID=UPI00163C03A4|nr:helix-turn-helix domain-containing protein [Cetobacterium sp. 2A]MBC2855318.1 helix-turn-helix domain-containing protein [Cetobacterium sp. 2A]MBC2856804.1 helix-turn-helix domain-containing protein [Cetobacterium sp. 2A]MBC2856845.1 helix-turn-helix domain-containing protein [Cetobacterium sp. 2A]
MRDKRSTDWFWLENEIVDRIDLEPMERLLYVVLARHANNHTSESFPSEETLCLKTGVKDKRTIRKYINSLELKNMIEVKREQGKSNRYFLKNIKVVSKNETTKNDTTDKNCNKAVTFDAQTSNIECDTNKTITRLNNNIMIHEHDFFENLFKELNINFTLTNQKSVSKLLKTLSKEQVNDYLIETYDNLKVNPDIKNLSGAFSKKIMNGDRQSKYKVKTFKEQKEIKAVETITKEKPVTTNTIVEDTKQHQVEEREILDIIFSKLSQDEQNLIKAKALAIARIHNSFEPFALLLADNKIKYDLIKELNSGRI